MTYIVDEIADFPIKRLIDNQHTKYEEWDRYFTGEIFDERSESLAENDEEPPLLYPLRINLCKMMCIIHAQALLGQWEDRIVRWSVQPKKDTKAAKALADDVESKISGVWDDNLVDQFFAETSLGLTRYGGIVIKLMADPSLPNGVRIEAVNPRYFVPRWHPTDTSKILECWVQFQVTRKDAEEVYGVQFDDTSDNQGLVWYSEHWTPQAYTVVVDGKVVPDFSGPNPYGFVPFVYIPRIRSINEFYGMSVIEDVMGLQDELNLRLADMGDRINYTAHPVRWVRNYRGKKDNLFISPDHFIDLGASIGDQHDPEMGSLPAETEPASTLSYINFIWDLSKYTVMTPPVALGQDEGSQRSGLTLTLRMWPLEQTAKWTRIFLQSGLKQVNDMILRIKLIRDYLDDVADPITSEHLGHSVKATFAPILPRDRMDLINELSQMWGGDHPAVSLDTIVKLLGYVDDRDAEIANVLSLWKDMAEMRRIGRTNTRSPDPGVSEGLPVPDNSGAGA